MKRMRNKSLIKALLMAAVAVTVSAVSSTTAYAARTYKDFLKNEGRIDCVDYTRIKTGQATEIPVTIRIGEVSCWTVIKEGEKLPKEDQDQIIRQVMLELDMTEEKLAQCEYTRWRAAQSVPGFDSGRLMVIAEKIMAGMMYGVSPPGTKAFVDYTGGKDGYEIAHDFIVGKGNHSAYAGKALPGIYGIVGAALLSAEDEVLAGMAAEIRHNQLLQRALEYEAELDCFYDRCNLEIEAREVMQAEYSREPRISCHKTVIKDAQVFGVTVPQTWKIDLELVRRYNPEPGGVGGNYKGTASITISHDLGNLAALFKKNVILGPGSPFLVVPQSTNRIVTKPMGTWILRKTLSADEVLMSIYDNVGENTGKEVGKMDIDSAFTEEDTFNLLDKVNIIPIIGIQADDEGHWEKGGISGNHGTKVYVYPGMRAVDGRRYPALKNYSSVTVNEVKDPVLKKMFGGVMDSHGPSEPWVVDHQVYKDLKNNCITVEGGWKGYDKVFGK